MYSKEVMKRFKDPENSGKMKDPDGVGEQGNLKCGDVMKLYIKVKKGKIVDAKFKTFGCAAAIAAADMLCDLIKGKSIKEAMKIKREDILKPLGELPAQKVHCSVLGVETLHKAIEDCRKRGRC